MKTSANVENEQNEVLSNIEISTAEAEEEFNDLAELAAQLCNTAIATITITQKKRVLINSVFGLDPFTFSSNIAFTSADQHTNTYTIVENTLQHLQLQHHPLVTGYPNIRFYAGMPIKTDDPDVSGTISVMDIVERKLSDQQIEGLKKLSKQAATLYTLKAKVKNQKLKEEEYAISLEQQTSVFEKSIHAVVVLNSAGEIVQWNRKAETSFGWTKKEAIGKPFNETIIAENSREAHKSSIQLYEEKGTDPQSKSIEICAVKKDNSVFEIELTTCRITIKNNFFYICYINDNTDRNLVTAKLDKQKEFYENILNKIPTDIAVFDANHKYLFLNPGAIKNDEFRKYIIGKDDFEYAEYRQRDKSIAEQRREKFLEVKNLNKEIRWEDSLKDPFGNTITHLRRLFPVKDENGNLTMMIGFGIDITERKIMEEKQTALVKQLSAQNIQLVDFCNIVSHNLRAPLANMSMLVKFIEECDNNEEQKALIAMLNPVIDNLHMTFNELVESIQIKQDLEIQSETIALEDCVKRTLDGMELEIKECGALIISDFEAAPVITYPGKYLYSIFHNLITNAVKYKDPSKSLVITLKTQNTGNEVLLSVSDNGLGIDVEKHKDNIFKIGKVFHRHPSAKGFGLFMTKTQVEAGGGRIWVESTPGIGSTFFISFVNQDK